MAITVQQLKQYMEASKNILIAGEAGTGKTQMLKAAADELGLSMKYYSSSTLDPFADLVGIPVPNTITKLVEYYRPKEIDEAQVIFFDELNRADPKTINAVMEIIQFRSINGDPLRNLKCIVAAINPVDKGYNTDELDIAVRDRFDFFLTSEVVADYSFFKAKFGVAVARTAIDLFKDYQSSYKEDRRSKKNTLGYFSPRRLEKVLDAFIQFQTAEIIAASLPDDVIIAHKHWASRLEGAIIGVKKIDINSDEVITVARELIKLGPSELRKKQTQEPLLKTYRNLKLIVAEQQKSVNSEQDDLIKSEIPGDNIENSDESMSSIEEKLMYRLRTSTALALNAGINTSRITEEYGEIVRDFDRNQNKTLLQNWQYTKVQNYNEALRNYLRNNPEISLEEANKAYEENVESSEGVETQNSISNAQILMYNQSSQTFI
jgi:DNA polymerase III delta prime subunit